jgi:hypothetical protein
MRRRRWKRWGRRVQVGCPAPAAPTRVTRQGSLRTGASSLQIPRRSCGEEKPGHDRRKASPDQRSQYGVRVVNGTPVARWHDQLGAPPSPMRSATVSSTAGAGSCYRDPREGGREFHQVDRRGSRDTGAEQMRVGRESSEDPLGVSEGSENPQVQVGRVSKRANQGLES